ncbi:biliverdin-producing heme oxygenase [Telluribacter sp. SYSU D00476]|uniref:biliverdin-producing heme oxygenase n=1 Tax=Telluribacter sp. SYSU D00476 TaxID=2811430 RepID=UPI001FF46650|nr:biliverdin-producing heme oxygenase [Telluribacter sp. SYSU D00476]
MTPLHAQLKSATAELHDKTEKALFVDDIVSNQLNREQLSTIILAQYWFNGSLEQALRPYDALRQEYEANHRYKTDLLLADLAELGIAVPDQMPEWTIKSEAELLGACYVAEGSTLGGKVIKKHLGQTTQLNGLSFHYYSVYATETGPQWKRFLAFLDQQSGKLPQSEVVQGAQYAFSFLLDSIRYIHLLTPLSLPQSYIHNS